MRQGLTFDDVLLVPKRSSVFSRKDVDTSTRLSRNIKLNVPIVASNMDTVCESKMSIVMAQLGALQIWRNYKKDPKKAMESYKKALSLGNTVSILEVYEAAGIKFDFSVRMIKELMEFVWSELDKL